MVYPRVLTAIFDVWAENIISRQLDRVGHPSTAYPNRTYWLDYYA
jgi:hypothetical protein